MAEQIVIWLFRVALAVIWMAILSDVLIDKVLKEKDKQQKVVGKAVAILLIFTVAEIVIGLCGK